MRQRLTRPLLVLALAAVAATVPFAFAPDGADAEESPAAVHKVEDLAWMAGNWRRSDGPSVFDEMWMAPGGGTMAALSRERQGEQTQMYELSAIEKVGDKVVLRLRHFGKGLTLSAKEGDGPMSWTLVTLQDRRAVFENPETPFPRRIIYERTTAADGDTLQATLDAGEGTGGMSFELKQVK